MERLLDINADMKAIQNTMNVLKKIKGVDMTDEEKAEEYIKNVRTELENQTYWVDCTDEVKQAYLDGLAEGKPKWHDVRKDPNDLPKLADTCFTWSITVANQNGEACIYNYRRSCWQTCLFTKIDEPIKWCELPKFKE
ncbi:MAG: hypothetical protein MJZ03_04435 [archaeon]|nr:hypothetical protein [archaeon]